MDQSALEKLLRELQHLDGDDNDGSVGGVVAAGAPSSEHQPDSEGRRNEDQPASSLAAGSTTRATTVVQQTRIPVTILADPADGSGNELERLLGSLKPIVHETGGAAYGSDVQQLVVEQDDASNNNGGGYYGGGYARARPVPRGGAFDSITPSGGGAAASVAPDLRKYTFAQALPVITRLAGDPRFIDQLQEMKSQQEAFELTILDERNKAKADLEKQLKVAQVRSKESGLTYEIDRVNKLLNAVNAKFDKQALQRWDTLARDQQARLEKMGVPCFFVIKSPDPIAQERQRRVMETLVTLLNDS